MGRNVTGTSKQMFVPENHAGMGTKLFSDA